MNARARAAHIADNPIWRFSVQVMTVVIAGAVLAFFSWLKELEEVSDRIDRRLAIAEERIELRRRDAVINAEAIQALSTSIRASDTSTARLEEKLLSVTASQARIEGQLNELLREQRAQGYQRQQSYTRDSR